MPKRGKRNREDDKDVYEGRPPDLTLGAFFQTTQEQCVETTSSNDVVEQADEEPAQEESQLFFVTRTKKGKLPITYENRSKGKKVTVISNVSGDAEGLVTELRRRLGVGGVSRGTFVELQGDQQKHVEQFLTKHPCLK